MRKYIRHIVSFLLALIIVSSVYVSINHDVRFDNNFDHVSLWVRHGVPFVCIEPWEGRVGLLQKPECPKLMPNEEKTVWAQFEI